MVETSGILDEQGEGTVGGVLVFGSSIFGVVREASTRSEKFLKPLETAATF